jgi:hypothetical protein
MAPPPFSLADAEWLAHRHVEGHDRIRFVSVPRSRHSEIPFLIDDCLGDDLPAHDLPVAQCLADAPAGRLHFLFHSAFCGSTMLVRAFDAPGIAMGLSEPTLLNDVVGFRRRGAQRSAVARLADCAIRLAARPFAPGEVTLVKPSNIVNPLAELMLALSPQSRAVFLYAPLETFLISVARKGLHCRLWVRELAEGYLIDGLLAPLGVAQPDLLRQTDLQVAAVGWLAQQRHFAALAAALGSDRVALLDAEDMTADPAGTVAAVADHYGIALGEGKAARIAAGPAFSRHSKSGEAYSPAARRDDYALARESYGEEIGMVISWAEKVAEAAGIVLDPPERLLQA